MYVNVVPHVNDEGRIDPLAVIWPDGRTFRIDEVLYRGEPRQMQKGAKTSRFRIRFGRKETNLYLERRQGSPALGTPDVDRSPRHTAQEVKQGVAGGRNMDLIPQNATFPVKMDFNPSLSVIPSFYGMYSISIASGVTSAAIGDGAQKRENESGPKGERPSTREHLVELVAMRVRLRFPRGWWRKRLLQLPLQRQRLRRPPSRRRHRRLEQGVWGR